ncbi:uncharacterized protein PHALS_14565 [Plasmopara halstedii]|uniref:Uncharacterized protein n=1 Tax=Plasmopara halstedii TaxID=4781 RepID=A0A0P1AM26_PLAHL|nr:uncharacterized protein PHALS_14565 [Plasmopara halstedii]CEG41777.1 hypothetical protein PHALS_14565 [Plasmopara halstedii]|eukprot:XP_024578146.1 hypothetical protein PHALS_14565 [Plasmopara halstedii]
MLLQLFFSASGAYVSKFSLRVSTLRCPSRVRLGTEALSVSKQLYLIVGFDLSVVDFFPEKIISRERAYRGSNSRSRFVHMHHH